MATVGGFLGGGVEIVPAGKHQIYLQWQTADRQNISGVTFTIGTQTIPADEYGRAVALVDSGSAVTITCSHSGTYSGDGPQTINTPSAEQTFVYFYGAKNSALDAYPVGSIYMSAIATDPSTLLGGGTWKRIAQGRTLIGEGTSDQKFSAGAMGGESNHALSQNEVPSHSHDFSINEALDLNLDSGTFSLKWSTLNIWSDIESSGIVDYSSERDSSGECITTGVGAVTKGKYTITPTGTATLDVSGSTDSAGGGHLTTISRHIWSVISGNVLRKTVIPGGLNRCRWSEASWAEA